MDETFAAGHVIEAFGFFVMQGNVIIGIIVFLILTLINFIVITKGSGRIAEVAARFSLDAMPGYRKQMAIDADLSAGLIDEASAKLRRKDLEDESAFYGAMDGANKFVRGDAIAGVIITFINLIGGIIIGIVQRGLPFDQAINTYALLTIGDGLVSQIPALVISLSAGLLVTKAGNIGSADKAIFGQLGQYPQSLLTAAIVTGLMALLPGLPFIPFFILALLIAGIGYTIIKARVLTKEIAKKEERLNVSNGNQSSADTIKESINVALNIDLVKLELGYGLLELVSASSNHRLTNQIKGMRNQIAKDLGFVMPTVRIQDNIQLERNYYVIKIKEILSGQGEIFPNKIMVMNTRGEEVTIPGQDVIEPIFGLKARWVSEEYRDEALFRDYTIIDASTVVTTHLTEIVKENITELLSYTEVHKLLDELSDEHKKLVKDTVPDIVSISMLQKVLQHLLAESVSIRDLATILEAIADIARNTKSIITITEFVRSRLAKQICFVNTTSDGFIPVVSLSSNWENLLSTHLVGNQEEKQLAMPPSQLQEFIQRIKQVYNEQAAKGNVPILLTNSNLRPYIRFIIERFRPSTVVMSQNEIHPRAKIRTFAVI